MRCPNSKVGPEQCLCGHGFSNGQPYEDYFMVTRQGNLLCKEGQFCRWISSFGYQCLNECNDLPNLNNEQCLCLNEVCSPGSFCNLTKGCVPDCPQDYFIFSTDTNCACNSELMDPTTHYCKDNIKTQLPEVCPIAPEVALELGCVCNDTKVCQKDQMCEPSNGTCVTRPEPCPALPIVAGTTGCYCEIGEEICGQEMSCGGENTSCFEPAKCKKQDWSIFNAKAMTLTSWDSNENAVERDSIDLMCDEDRFTNSSLINGTFLNHFSVECGPDKSWIGLEACVLSFCDALDYETESVVETIWGEVDPVAKTVKDGSISKVQCKNEGHTFSNSPATGRQILKCYRMKWYVDDNILCPNNTDSCSNPIRFSCSMTGCEKLPDPYLNRISYEPKINAYLKGSTLKVSCSNGSSNLYSMFEQFEDPSKTLTIQSPVYVAQTPVNNGYCPHNNCLASTGVQWTGKDGKTKSDCVQEKKGKYFCIKSSQIKWNGSSYTVDECSESSRSIKKAKGVARKVLTYDNDTQTPSKVWTMKGYFIMNLDCRYAFNQVILRNRQYHIAQIPDGSTTKIRY